MAEERSPKKRGIPAAASLTDDLVVEILSRLPVKSVTRFRCVCRAWRRIISDANHRKKLPQTLAGFFYSSYSMERFPTSALHFTNMSGRGIPLIFPSFAFLPKHGYMRLLDCCNGLLLCRCEDVSGSDYYHYFVCNPATKEWTALPDSGPAGRMCTARLGFDPAVSPHFHVFQLVEAQDEEGSGLLCISGVELYSSETGGWVHRDSGWSDVIYHVDNPPVSVFVDGCLHFLTLAPSLATVDTEGKTWRNIPVPQGLKDGFIRQSQGRLYYANFEMSDEDVVRLVIYVLEDHGSHEWILKHSVMASDILGRMRVLCPFDWVAIHPECSLIFFTAWLNQTLMSYDMNLQKVERIRNLGRDCHGPYLSYVPLYSELKALHI